MLTLINCLSQIQKDTFTNQHVKTNTKAHIARGVVNQHIKEDPEFEVWDECIYYPLIVGTKAKSNSRPIKYPDYLVSNRGRVYSIKTNTCLTPSKDKKGYLNVNLDGDIRKVHRLVGASYCPKPTRHRDTTLSALQINHINCDKTCNESWNLEWITNKENQDHAITNNLVSYPKGVNKQGVIPMKGTVVDIPEHNGKVIVVCGGDDYKQYGLYANSLWQVREGKMSKHKGCTWEVIDIKEYSALRANNCLKLAEAMKNLVSVITYRLTHKETGDVIDGLTGRELRDKHGFNETHLKGTWEKQGTIKGYSVQRFEDGEELIPPEKPKAVMKTWVLVGDGEVLKISKPEDFATHGFNKANVMRSMKLGFKAIHPTTGKKYNVFEANFSK
ncbi:HNH endonuclease [Shewanella phage FishSpeaker]|nr:HNH endonuclease [Shewanella phage FishSpeaker]